MTTLALIAIGYGLATAVFGAVAWVCFVVAAHADEEALSWGDDPRVVTVFHDGTNSARAKQDHV